MEEPVERTNPLGRVITNRERAGRYKEIFPYEK